MFHSIKQIASLSLDLDNKWSYMKTHGDAGWEQFPSYLSRLVPRVLELLDRHELKITFFVVGQDAALPQNAEALRSIANLGHEIGTIPSSTSPGCTCTATRRLRQNSDPPTR